MAQEGATSEGVKDETSRKSYNGDYWGQIKVRSPVRRLYTEWKQVLSTCVFQKVQKENKHILYKSADHSSKCRPVLLHCGQKSGI